MSYYCTPADIRDLVLGVTIDEATDDSLYEFIDRAQKIFLGYVQVKDNFKRVYPDSNGKILLPNKYVADRNFDKTVDEDDITIYGYINSDDPRTKTELTISSLHPEDGILYITEADVNLYEMFIVDYSYYTCAIDWELVRMAVSYYAGMLWVAKEEFLVPPEVTIGNIKIRQKEPWNNLREEFHRIVTQITEVPMSVVHYKKMVISPRRYGKTTSRFNTVEYEDLRSRGNEKVTI